MVPDHHHHLPCSTSVPRTAQRSLASGRAMGRRKFRFSDMMPNSWVYKLRVMRRAGGGSGAGGASVMHHSSSSQGAKGSTQPARTPRPMPVPMPHRTSYYYASRDRVPQPAPAPQPTRAAAAENHHQLVPQTQSSSRSYRRRHRVGPVEKAAPPVAETPPDAHHHRRRDTCVGRDGVGDVGKQPLKPAMKEPSSKNIVTGKVIASDTGIMFDLHAEDMPERVLRPIVTKPVRVEASRYETKERHVVHHTAVTPRASSASEQGSKGNSRRPSVSSGCRLKTRTNSPRLASRCRKSRSTNPATTPAASSPQKTTPPPPLAESFAVVKASVDPRKDFRESMEEMIAEKSIRDAGDLEDLLACYLALNAGEHHDLIVEVFEEIWASLASVNP